MADEHPRSAGCAGPGGACVRERPDGPYPTGSHFATLLSAPGHVRGAILAPDRGDALAHTEQEAPARQACSLDTLYRTHMRALYAFVYSRVGNREAAEDITSQVFIKAVTHLDPTRPESSIIAWLYRVARTTITDYWRAGKGPHMIALDDVYVLPVPSSLSDPARQRDTAAQATAVLKRLPDNYRTVLTLRILDGLSVAETARRMKTSGGNVKVLQHRALKDAARRAGARAMP